MPIQTFDQRSPSLLSPGPIRAFWRSALRLSVLLLLLSASPAVAWTPESQNEIALDAARLAPPDLYRQLSRNRAAFLQGVQEPFRDGAPPESPGQLEAAIHQAIQNAQLAIELHRPFNEIAYRLGVVSHFLAHANDPLATDDSDPAEPRIRNDFRRYLASTEPRVRVVFYGFHPDFDDQNDVARLLRRTLERGRGFYPLVGREYRRIGFGSGVRGFDDRSTAYAVASLARSHAVSDIAEVLRYIWLESGGIDTRPRVPWRGERVVQIQGSSSR